MGEEVADGTPRSPGRRGAADRVRRSHAQTRTTVRCALAFILAAALAAAWGEERWLALHLFLAGGVVLAISGVSLMLTVTWSAAPAPSDRWVAVQRGAIVVGAAGIGIGRAADLPGSVAGVAGGVYVVGLAGLAVLLVATVRRGVERRFDVAVASYLAAVAMGLVGAGIGVHMAVDGPSIGLRSAHATANLLGLVGLVVGGTLPFFGATVGRSRMAARATPVRLAVTLGWRTAMVVLAVAALAIDAASWAAVALGGYAVGTVAVLVWMPQPTRRQLRWAGPRLVALWAGTAWWTVAVGATALEAADGQVVFGGRWLGVVTIAGYAQILWGSLAYLMPMLRGGGHERLAEGFATTRSWVGLVAVNVAGVAMVASWGGVAVGAVAVWVLDGAWRAARVGVSRSARPAELSADRPAEE